jgi:Fe-S cluster assembly protein SufD
MSSSTLSPAAKSIIGSFAADTFTQHLATVPATPAWWLERKRAAYQTFASLPLPKRTDESWRFSNVVGLNLDGFLVNPPLPKDLTLASPFGPAHLSFANNTLIASTPLAADLVARGVIVTTR